MLIQVLLGMNFDAVVVFVKTFLLLFRLALAILCVGMLIFRQKSFQFCIPRLKTQQPVLP